MDVKGVWFVDTHCKKMCGEFIFCKRILNKSILLVLLKKSFDIFRWKIL